MITFEEYVAGIAGYLKENPSQRYGQAACNYLDIVRPEFWYHPNFLEIDPFYDTSKCQQFFEWLQRNWDDE